MDRQRDKRIVITLGSNYVGLKEKYDVLMRMFLNENEIEYYKKYFLFVESIILRVSSMPTVEQEMKDKLSIQGGNRPTLQVNRCITEAFRSEELPDFFILEEDTLKIMRLKIWKANTLHCSLAFMGKYYGKQFIYECARDDQISKYAFYASEEGDNALAKLYGASTKYSEADLTDTWKSYQDDNLQDFVDRVGADPIRKLSRNERFIGPALLCMKYHIFPYFICKCAAYGFFYSDKTNGDIVSKVKEEGIEKTIETVCGLNLMEQNEKLIYDMILHSYYEILQENPVRKLTCK